MATDYIKRMIEDFGIVWAKLVRQRSAGKPEDARLTLNQTAERLFGLNISFLDLLPADQLLALCQTEAGFDGEKALVLANMFKLEADLRDTEQAASLHVYQRALQLYTFAAQAQEPEIDTYQAEIDDLLLKIQHYELPTSTLELILALYEQRGTYGSAEDYLFGLTDIHGPNPELIASAEVWYQRLLDHSDADLSAGDLPRQEALEGIAKLRELHGIKS